MQDATTAVAAALLRALQSMVSAGMLPLAAYPAPRVAQTTAKQRVALASSVMLTSPWAFPLAAAARKAAGMLSQATQGIAVLGICNCYFTTCSAGACRHRDLSISR